MQIDTWYDLAIRELSESNALLEERVHQLEHRTEIGAGRDVGVEGVVACTREHRTEDGRAVMDGQGVIAIA